VDVLASILMPSWCDRVVHHHPSSITTVIGIVKL
jgi:hypothetical protein